MDITRIKHGIGGNPLWPNGIGPASAAADGADGDPDFTPLPAPPRVETTLLAPRSSALDALPGPDAPLAAAQARAMAHAGYQQSMTAMDSPN